MNLQIFSTPYNALKVEYVDRRARALPQIVSLPLNSLSSRTANLTVIRLSVRSLSSTLDINDALAVTRRDGTRLARPYGRKTRYVSFHLSASPLCPAPNANCPAKSIADHTLERTSNAGATPVSSRDPRPEPMVLIGWRSRVQSEAPVRADARRSVYDTCFFLMISGS